MTGEWSRTGLLPASVPLATVSWDGTPIVSTGASVFKLDCGAWQRLGDHLAAVSCLAVTSDGDLIAGGHFGVHRWNDETQSWLPVVALLNVCALAVDGNRLIAATGGDGVFASDDDGATWWPHSLGLPDQRVIGLSAMDGGLLLSTPTGSFELPSGAERWRPCDQEPSPPTVADITGLIELPACPVGDLRDTPHGLVWSARDGAQYRSADGGASWIPEATPVREKSAVLQGLPADLRDLREGAYGAVAVVERARPVDRWTAVLRGPGREGPWVPVLSTNGTVPVVIAEHRDSLLVAIGHRILKDPLTGGSRPEPAGQLPDPHAIVLALSVGEGEVLAATANGVWRSTDGGTTWEHSMESAIPMVAVCAGVRGVAVDADGVIFTMLNREAA